MQPEVYASECKHSVLNNQTLQHALSLESTAEPLALGSPLAVHVIQRTSGFTVQLQRLQSLAISLASHSACLLAACLLGK